MWSFHQKLHNDILLDLQIPFSDKVNLTQCNKETKDLSLAPTHSLMFYIAEAGGWVWADVIRMLIGGEWRCPVVEVGAHGYYVGGLFLTG
jgi:hypothetical protein